MTARSVWLALGTAICGGLALAAAADPQEAPPPSTPPAIEHAVLDNQLRHLRGLIIRLREAHPDRFAPGTLDRTAGDVAGSEPLDRVAARLGKELSLLEQAVLELSREGEAGEGFARAAVRELSAAGGRYVLELPGDAVIVNESVEIANVGDVPVVDPRLVVDGRRDWFDVDALRAEIVGDATTEKERAERLWAFLVSHRFHSEPAHSRAESHDPIKLLNVYGYGFCDDAATVYAALARSLGLEARVWGLSGHVVPEVRYGGAWHMYDPDHEAYYLDARDEVASVVEISEHPDLLDHPVLLPGRDEPFYRIEDEPFYRIEDEPFYRIEKVKGIFASSGDNELAGYRILEDFHDMGFTLRPGERIVRHWDHRGYRFSDGYYRVPRRFGNGEWIYQRDLADGEDFPVEIDFALPYPILGGAVRVRFDSIHSKADWVVEVRRAGGGWQRLAWAPPEGRVWSFGLDGVLANGSGDPDYALAVRLSPTRDDVDGEVRFVRTELLFQLAPEALPALEPGPNDVTWSSASSEGRVRVIHRYREE